VGVAAAGGFEPSQPIRAVTPKARQIICTIFMEMLFKAKSFLIQTASLRDYLSSTSGSSLTAREVNLSPLNL
jgi:hypothetical protein